jgi:transcriptional regulator with XRE-family HTH domain
MPTSPDVLRAWRRSRGWDKPELARRLRKAAGGHPVPAHDALVRMIHYWESGQRGITERYELLYAAAPEVKPDYLGLGPADGDLVARPARRAALADGADAGGQDVDLLRQLRSGAAVDAEVIGIYRAETQNLRMLDRRLGAPAVIGKTTAHIELLAASLHYTLNAGIRRRVASVLGESLTLAGWQLVDLGSLRDAWDYYERAKAAAREAVDAALLAHAAAEQAYVLADLNATGDALDLIQQTYGTYRRLIPGRLRSWVKAAEAEIAAMGANERACRVALDDAANDLPAGDEDDELPYLVLDQVHFARWRGNCLSYFGDASTISELARVLGEMDASFTRAAAGVHCGLARAMFAQGEVCEARTHVGEAHRLAALTGSARQQRRVARLAAQVG